jgi:hypothetical protein
MYNEMTVEEDRKMAESWKADADGILTFVSSYFLKTCIVEFDPQPKWLQTGLFSAAVATLVSVSIQDLQPNPQNSSPSYLGNIYQLQDPNTPISASLDVAPRFSPPRYAVWVNSFWFLSLAMSLTCGLLATLLQQWARRYITITQPSCGPRKRARIRAFFAEGLASEKRHLHLAVEALPILLHMSLFVFFAGLLVLLFNTDHTVFGIVAGWVGLCVAVYGYITFIPVFRQDRPYFSPLSSPAWSLLNGTMFAAIRALYWSGILDCVGFAIRDRMINLGVVSKKRFIDGIVKTAQETALKVSPEIDTRAIMWTFDSLDEDDKLERFFAGISGLCSSNVFSNPSGLFIEPYKWSLSDALVGLMHRTLTSNLIGESVRKRRSLICTRAMHATSLPIHPYICEELISGGWDGLLNYVEFGHFIKWTRYNDPSMAYYSACMVAIVIAQVKERGDLWRELAMGQLGISAHDLQNYLAHGDSVLLANYIHILRDIVHVHFYQFQSGDAAPRWKVLELVSQFDVQDTLPTLQHDFCDLWNEVVHMTATTPDYHIRSILIVLLKNVRRAYIALHDGTDSAPTAFSGSTADDEHALFSPSSYPLCNIPCHRRLHASPFFNAIALTPPTQPSYDFPPFSMPHNTVPSAAPSGYTPQNQMNLMGHQYHPTFASTSHSALDAPVHGGSNLPVPPRPVHSSNPLYHAHPRAFPLSVFQDTSSPACFSPVIDNVFNNTANPYIMPQAGADPAAQPDDARTGSHVSIPAAECSVACPARPASAVYRGAGANGGGKASLCKGQDILNLLLDTNTVTAPHHSPP